MWHPATHEAVAVTPAPVALVLPSGPAVPPPLPTIVTPPPLPAQSLATPPPLPLPTAMPELPPQRVAPPEPPLPPKPVPVNPSVLPATGPSHHWAATGGAVAAVLVVVVMIVALPAQGAKRSHTPAVATSEDAQLDLRALANAEETTLTATRVYTTSDSALAASGYQPMPNAPVTILAGVHRKRGYCLVATAGGTKPWYLYDSKQGGLLNVSFTSAALAQQACTDSAIATYLPVS